MEQGIMVQSGMEISSDLRSVYRRQLPLKCFERPFYLLLSSHLMLGSPDVEKRLEDALDLITTNADWKAPAFGASLAEIISKGEDNQKLKTAAVPYIGHLQALDTATSLDRGADLAIQILNSAPLPIHDALASVTISVDTRVAGPLY